MAKNLSFQVGNLRFIDINSSQFLSASLDKLVSLLGRDKFTHTTKHLDERDLIFYKGYLSIFVYVRTREIRRNPTPTPIEAFYYPGRGSLPIEELRSGS